MIVDSEEKESRRPTGPITVGALDQEQASIYLGLGPGSRWLDGAPIRWIDMRRPGARQPLRRWLVKDLDAFLESRRVQPGHPSPFEP
jgi:hypothetical protein